MARGTRNVGLLEQLGYRKGRKVRPAPPTEEQKAAARAVREEFLRQMAPTWGVPADEVDAWVKRQAA